ncbi:MAG: CBS domain-containing protein [Dehalococcoidia bacterium]|nr:CBS domain-containing protein [Dehalococcoidia bacterium]
MPQHRHGRGPQPPLGRHNARAQRDLGQLQASQHAAGIAAPVAGELDAGRIVEFYLSKGGAPCIGFVREVLADKGSQVHTVPVGGTVRDAVHEMNAAGVGALVVVQLGDVAGIFTERDVLKRVVDAGLDPEFTRVAEVMSAPVRMIRPETRVSDAMDAMTRSRIRHLPVVRDGQLAGIISIGDLLRWVTQYQQADLAQMAEYITGPVSHTPPAGARSDD